MAARRFTKSAVDWAKFVERIPEQEMANFRAFKARSDGYLRVMYSMPENPPAIDFAAYKKRLPDPKIVDELEQKYKSFKVPFPADTATAQLEAHAREDAKRIAELVAESKERVVQNEKELDQFRKLLPIEHMTIEDYHTAFPDCAFNPEKPSFAPHTPEHQQMIADAASGKLVIEDDH